MAENGNAEHQLRRQTEAAKRVIASLAGDGEDDDLRADMIEGETSLKEAIEAAMDEIDETEIIITGLEAKKQAFEGRIKASKDRVSRLRATIEQAMLATDQHSFRLATGTLSLRKVPPGLIVTNEADIPTRFWIEQERPAPKLDKKALTEAIKNEAIPGATLDNGTYSLSIRRK